MKNKTIIYSRALNKPEYEYAPEYDFGDNYGKDDDIKAIFFKSVCEKQETKVFGYLGKPKNNGEKLPAVVLVHGGGGTAFDDWVKMWTDRGYVALALDTEGNVPVKGNKLDWQEHPKSGYFGKPNARFQDTTEDINDTWMHYATSSVMAAGQLLKSLDCVDENKVGVCGISWGGVITMLTVCHYAGFAFAIPVYLAMHVIGSGVQLEESYHTDCARVWEDSPITKVKTPMLFIGDIYDRFTSVEALSKCAEDVGGGFTSFQVGFGHGHATGANRQESFTFADYITKGGKPPAKFIGRPDFKEKSVRFEQRGNRILSAKIHYCDKARSVAAEDWHEAEAVINEGFMCADKGINCEIFYFEAKDERDNIFTSLACGKKD